MKFVVFWNTDSFYYQFFHKQNSKQWRHLDSLYSYRHYFHYFNICFTFIITRMFIWPMYFRKLYFRHPSVLGEEKKTHYIQIHRQNSFIGKMVSTKLWSSPVGLVRSDWWQSRCTFHMWFIRMRIKWTAQSAEYKKTIKLANR